LPDLEPHPGERRAYALKFARNIVLL